MLVVENPSLYDRPTAKDAYNSFVVIAIDPVASVALLEDEQATREAAAMRPTKYLALINKDVGFEMIPEAGMPKLSLQFYFARDGLPDEPNDWAAIPLAPAPPHPRTGRAPVTSSFPLPWSNCHIATLHTLFATVSRIYQHHTPGPSITRPQRRQLAHMLHRDVSEYNRTRTAGDDPTTEWDEALALAREYVAQAAAEQSLPGEGYRDGARGMMDIFPRNDVAQMKLHVEMWVDVTSIERPGDPANLEAEIQRLKQIEWEWAKRVVAESLASQSKPETSAWLDGIAGADAPAYDEVLDDMDGDMTVVPDDAIEHRGQHDVLMYNGTSEQDSVLSQDDSVHAPESDSVASLPLPSRSSSPPAVPSPSAQEDASPPLRTILYIDEPSVLDQPVDPGAFVVIAIDPVASVAALRDEQATREAAELKPGRYLAFLNSNVGFDFMPAAGAPRISFSFCLVARGLPNPPHEWAATPIAPAPAHPLTGREALIPSPPVPWSDCYINNLVSEVATVSRLYQHRTPGPVLAEADWLRAGDYANDDNEAYESDEDEDRVVPEYEAAMQSFREELREAEAEAAAAGIFPQEDESVPLSMGDFFGRRNAREMKLHIEMWVDVESISQPGDHASFEAEVARLKEIEWEWAKRVVAESMVDRPETSAWLQSISGADAPSFDVDGDLTDAPHVDMSITPEDAIEHRVERAALLKTGSLPADAVDVPAETAASTPVSASASPSDLIPASSLPAQEDKVDTPARASTPASDKRDAVPRYSYTQSITRFFGGIISIFSRLRPVALRFRSLLFTWIWHPFTR
ncbi:hypothetical protein EXIGLDRAFT_736164 [Exidia glandulosa HHB12029]|uniref:Uncharacterized protein n=1 Tax=Exidia glandulosa HHB12029 TaxID=1314781 RepID=A0A166AT65_EXIGL|nr:hypothetical protein EXIGLDRAFT_736164 [Exidia glandulosa HHB12029]